MAKCKSCGAEIRWITTAAGKRMPCNPIGVKYWAQPKAKGKIITPNGEVVSCVFEGGEQQATGTGYAPHWSTCKSANQHRGKPERQGREQENVLHGFEDWEIDPEMGAHG